MRFLEASLNKSLLLANFFKRLHCGHHLVFAVGCRELYSNSGLTLGHDGVGEADDENAGLSHLFAEFR